MVPQKSSHAINHCENCPPPSSDDLAADLDQLRAKLDHAETLIAEAMTPDPVDWERHYAELFADLAGIARRFESEGGA